MKSTTTEITLEYLLELKRLYYTGKPRVSDAEYDEMESEFKIAYPGVEIPIGYEDKSGSRFPVFKHSIPMASQRKVHSLEELMDWIRKTGAKPSDLIYEHKLDGLSLSMEYDQGVLVRGLLRGGGIEGEDITANVRKMQGVPKTIPYKGSASIRAEIVLLYSDLKAHFSHMSNPRNAAVGIARRLDGEGSEHLTVIAYDIGDALTYNIHTEEGVIQQLRAWNFQDVFACRVDGKFYDREIDRRDDLNYMVDGLIIRVNGLFSQVKLGYDSQGCPLGQIALKFPPSRKYTILRKVEWETRRTGKIVPRGLFDEIKLLGANHNWVTLCNHREIERLGLRLNGPVIIEKRGDVIPKAYAAPVEDAGWSGSTPIRIPATCPSCYSSVDQSGNELYCVNPGCPAQFLNRIYHFIKCLDVKDIGWSAIEKLVESGTLRSFSDIYTLANRPSGHIAMSEGCGRGQDWCQKILSRLPKEMDLGWFVQCLGISGIASSAEVLNDHFQSVQELRDAPFRRLEEILGNAKARSLQDGLTMIPADDLRLLCKYIQIKIPEKKVVGSKYANIRFCMTGVRDAELSEALCSQGASEKSGVSGDCNLLIAKDPSSTSGKAQAARERGITILSQVQARAKYL